MKQVLPVVVALLSVAAIAAVVTAPASCSHLTPEQRQRLQAVAVPLTSLGLTYAQSQGLIEPGDRITLTQGVAIVVSPQEPEAKLVQLAELGMTHAQRAGLVQDGQTVEIKDGQTALILPPSDPPEPPSK